MHAYHSKLHLPRVVVNSFTDREDEFAPVKNSNFSETGTPNGDSPLTAQGESCFACLLYIYILTVYVRVVIGSVSVEVRLEYFKPFYVA